MRLVDPALPAVAHLVGPDAADVLRPPVEAAGGDLLTARPVAVQYRPGSDVVVRYSTEVAWSGAAPRRETIVAASALHTTFPGTVAVTANVGGDAIQVAVWRWPFDPFLHGLAEAVTPRRVATVLGLDRVDGVAPEVVAYRPTERAVVRVTHPPVTDVHGAPVTTSYLKVVAPDRVETFVSRHAALIAAGVPAPPVRRADPALGLVVLDELAGPTLRDLVKDRRTHDFPGPERFDELADALGRATTLGQAPPAPRLLTDGTGHAQMLATVDRTLRPLAERLAERFDAEPPRVASGIVHGDLHEAQLVIDRRRIVGLLDVDDVGPGDPLDDRANLIARLRYRAVTDAELTDVVTPYGDAVRSSSLARYPAAALDLATSAALVGLATGPFRVQQPGWRSTVADLLTLASALAGVPVDS